MDKNARKQNSTLRKEQWRRGNAATNITNAATKGMINNASRSNAICKQYKRSNARSVIRNFGRKFTGTSFQFEKLLPRERAWNHGMVAWIRNTRAFNHDFAITTRAAKQRKKMLHKESQAGRAWNHETLARWSIKEAFYHGSSNRRARTVKGLPFDSQIVDFKWNRKKIITRLNLPRLGNATFQQCSNVRISLYLCNRRQDRSSKIQKFSSSVQEKGSKASYLCTGFLCNRMYTRWSAQEGWSTRLSTYTYR